MSSSHHAIMKHHLLDHLVHHKEGIHQDQLVQKVANSAGVNVEEHRATIVSWVDHLVKAGHVSRDGKDWVTLLSPDHRRQDLLLLLEREDHL